MSFRGLLLLALVAASTLKHGVDTRRTVNKCCPSSEHLYFNLASSQFECENLRKKTERQEEIADDGALDIDPTTALSEDAVADAEFGNFLMALLTSSNASLNENDVESGVMPSCAPDDTDWLFAPRDFRLLTTPSAATLLTRGRHEFPAHAWCVDLDEEADLLAVVCPCVGVDAVCVRKCCPEGQAHAFMSPNCVISDLTPWTPTPRDYNMTYYLLNHKVPTTCQHYSLATYRRDQLTLLHNGSMKGRDNTGRLDEYAPGRFCVEAINSTNSSDTDDDLQVIFCIEIDAFTDAVTSFKGVVTLLGALALLVTVVLTIVFPEMRQHNLEKMVLYHNVSLMAAFFCIGAVQISFNTFNGETCKVLSFVMQFTLLAAFFWLNAMCIEISWLFTTLRPVKEVTMARVTGCRLIWYSVYAWGATSLISAITVVVEFSPGAKFRPRFGEANCFFHGDEKISQLLFLYGPMAILLSVNLGLFVYTATKIASLRRKASSKKLDLTLYVKLFTLMGVTWVLEIISWAVGGKNYYWLLVDTVNLFRGVFIFVIFCCKRSVLDLVRVRCGCAGVKVERQDSVESKSTSGSNDAHEMTSRRHHEDQ